MNSTIQIHTLNNCHLPFLIIQNSICFQPHLQQKIKELLPPQNLRNISNSNTSITKCSRVKSSSKHHQNTKQSPNNLVQDVGNSNNHNLGIKSSLVIARTIPENINIIWSSTDLGQPVGNTETQTKCKYSDPQKPPSEEVFSLGFVLLIIPFPK